MDLGLGRRDNFEGLEFNRSRLSPTSLHSDTYEALICLLADRPNVQDQPLVERLQHTYVEALHSYICIHRPTVSA